MGLDMYLKKHTYINNSWRRNVDEFDLFIERGPEDVKQERVCGIIERVGYWRKANAIHNWFVENVQGGEDDCAEHLVTRDQLKELLATVNTVLTNSELVDSIIQNGSYANAETGGKMVPNFETGKTIVDPSIAKALLPTASGFFFGSTDYNQWYYQDLVNTKEILEAVLAEENYADYYYQSSW